MPPSIPASSSEASDVSEDNTEYPLWDTPFKMQSVSPLHVDAFLTNESLLKHAADFRSRLNGGVRRGVPIDSWGTNPTHPNVGDLERVVWRVLTEAEGWNLPAASNSGKLALLSNDMSLRACRNRGIVILVEYEHVTYKAFLLRCAGQVGNVKQMDEQREFLSTENYPILLTAMPEFVRQEVVDYLTYTFDAHIEHRLSLPPTKLYSVLANYLDTIFTESKNSEALRTVVKDLVMTYGFEFSVDDGSSRDHSPLTMDIRISSGDLPKLLMGSPQNPGPMPGHQGPFMKSLFHYVRSYLAMSLGHQDVILKKLVCGAFELNNERIKLYRPLNEQQFMATRELLDSLAACAAR